MIAANRRPSYVHRGAEDPLVGLPIDAFLRRVTRMHAERDAVVSVHQGVRLTYADLDARVDDVARGLVAMGAGRGSRVGIWSTDNVEWVLVQLAAARIGGVLVNLNPAYKSSELAHALAAARVEILILIPSFRRSRYAEMLVDLCPETASADAPAFRSARLPALRWIVVVDPADPDATARPARAFLTWPQMIEQGRAVDTAVMRELTAAIDADDPVNIQFTSGTTGTPKAVVLTHHSILNNAWFVGDAMRFTAADRLCVPLPFYHCFGMVVANLVCLTRGAALVIPSAHFEAGAVLAAIERERCTAVHGVPSMFIAELDHPDFDRFDLSSLRTGVMGGAPCPPGLVRRVMTDMHCPEILIAYGQTEASPVTHLTRPDDPIDARVETVGTNLPHQEAKIVDPPTGAVVPIGTPGEVCFRGYHVMRGYDNDDAATRQVIDDAGWLHSGDLGVIDEAGRLRIVGRLKDMIIRGGENIYPAEVEALLFQHPAVAEAAVVGLPHPTLGEEVAAWVRLHDGCDSDVEALRAFVRERAAHFKVPAHVRIVTDFPRTISGKIQKFRIREAFHVSPAVLAS